MTAGSELNACGGTCAAAMRQEPPFQKPYIGALDHRAPTEPHYGGHEHDQATENTGSGPIPVLPEDEEDVLMRRFFGPDGRRNRGGRPRKDGTRADTSPTWAEAGFSKRTAAKIRAVGNLTHEEYEAAVGKRRAEFIRGGRYHALGYYLPDRSDNGNGYGKQDRKTTTNIRRLFSTLRRIAKDHEGDATEEGEMMRFLVKANFDLWANGETIWRQSR